MRFFKVRQVERGHQHAKQSSPYSNDDNDLIVDKQRADQQWKLRYEEDMKANEELERMLMAHLDRTN